jgi:hypothetical protein
VKGRGFLPDDPGAVLAEGLTRSIRKLVRASEPAESWTHEPSVMTIPDQGGTSSCVGQAFATAIETLAHVSGNPIERPSALAAYTGGRLLGEPHRPLVDGGSRPLDVLAALSTYGLVRESRFPFSEAGVNAPLPMDVFQHGADALLAAHYRITSDVANALRQTLFSGFVPVFAMEVDEAFMDLGDELYAPGGASLGLHMQAIVGYSRGEFLIAGSWGRSWARGGFARISADFLESRKCSSFIVPTIIPLKVT